MEFRLCGRDDVKSHLNQSCYDEHVLERPNGKGTKYRITQKNGPHYASYDLILPNSVHCHRCVLQWTYISGIAAFCYLYHVQSPNAKCIMNFVNATFIVKSSVGSSVSNYFCRKRLGKLHRPTGACASRMWTTNKLQRMFRHYDLLESKKSFINISFKKQP